MKKMKIKTIYEMEIPEQTVFDRFEALFAARRGLSVFVFRHKTKKKLAVRREISQNDLSQRNWLHLPSFSSLS